MVRSEVKNLARILARADENVVSDTDANTMVDAAYTQVAKDLGGFQKRAHIQIAAKFYIGTDFRFNLTIDGTGDTLAATDIQISSSELTEATGAAVATAMQTAIRAATGGTGTTVTWTEYYFTITTLLATAQTITAPVGNYTDATPFLFGSYTSVQDDTWVGGFPKDVTIEADLPSDFHSMRKVVWDGSELLPAPRDYFVWPGATGDPCYYDIRNDHLYLYPTPTSQKQLYLEYSATNVSASTSDTATYSIPTRYQMLIVYWLAYMLLLAMHEYDKANQQLAIYVREKNRALINKFSQNTDIEEATPVRSWYRVSSTVSA